MKTNPILFCSALMLGCTTGNNYPTKYANTVCESMFACIDDDSIEAFTNYDDVEECKADQEEAIRDSSTFDAFEEGDADFNGEAAEKCLTEISEVQNDSDCDGNMNIISYLADASSEDCGDVYE